MGGQKTRRSDSGAPFVSGVLMGWSLLTIVAGLVPREALPLVSGAGCLLLILGTLLARSRP